MKVWIHGYSGRMGQEITKQLQAHSKKWSLIGGSSPKGLYYQEQEGISWDRFENLLSEANALIDFSSVNGNRELLTALKKHGNISTALLIGSTGLSAEVIEEWQTLAAEKNFAILLAPNTSLGVLLTHQVSKMLGEVLSPLNFDIEILESHHRAKLDAPSGTARFLAQGLADTLNKKVKINRDGKRERDEIGLTSLRGGSVFGEHEIQYLGDEEEIRISHRALSRSLFAKGSLFLTLWISRQKPGFYRLEDIRIEDMIAVIKEKPAK